MKKLRLGLIAILSLSFLSLSNISCTDEDDNMLSIYDIINNDPNFSILAAAIDHAGLSSTLMSGSHTLFAPDNPTFIASGFTETQIYNTPPAEIANIISYHIVNGRFSSGNIPSSDALGTVQGNNLYLSRNANGIFANGFPVITADVRASNGFIHVISSLLYPPGQTIREILQVSSDFSKMNAAVIRGNLTSTFSNPGNYTLFVPDNEAFGTIDEATINSYPPSTVTSIVKSHTSPKNIFLSDFIENDLAPSLENGVSLLFTTSPESVKIDGSPDDPAYINSPDIIATNGVIHVIDRVLE